MNIGPIISTLGLARKPKELWAASYLFSHLMKCLYAEMEKRDVEIISPAKPEREGLSVGIYPDRIFVKGDIDKNEVMTQAMDTFKKSLEMKGEDILDLNYFNLMSVSCEAEKDSAAIKELNRKLDLMELCNLAKDGNWENKIYNLISKDEDSPLFQIATGKSKMSIPLLENIAKAQGADGKDIRSHHKYFCVVQADGDNVGKIISHEHLANGNMKAISQALMKFGLDATKRIQEFGGEPIYAGGDDLLFLAPVIGKKGNDIFALLEDIEGKSFKGVKELVEGLSLKDGQGEMLEASLSFGVSMTYHKYPLYEALETARKLLFEKAKKVEGKDAVAWILRKHSGGTFEAAISRKDKKLWALFRQLMEATTDSDTVSAVAHKLRQEDDLVNIVLDSHDKEKRLDALFKNLFEKLLEFDESKEGYFNAVKGLMPILYNKVGKDMYGQSLYCLLRTAKFIKGEELHDE